MLLTTRSSIERDRLVLAQLEQTRIQRILIVGGTGFIASALIVYLQHIAKSLKRPLSIRVLSRSASLNKSLGSNIEISDHPNQKEIRNLYHVFKPDTIFFISRIEHGVRDASIVSENLKVLNSHLEALIHVNPTPKLIFLSSGAVYGPRSSEHVHIPFNENIQLNSKSLSDYARVKIESENLIRSCFPETDSKYVIARLFTFFGPGLPLQNFAIGNFMLSKNQKEPLKIKGTGKTIRSYMYIDDLSAILIRLAAAGSGTVNVGDDTPVQIMELAEKFREMFGCSIVVLNEENFETYYVPDLSKLNSSMGRATYISLDDGLFFWSKKLEERE